MTTPRRSDFDKRERGPVPACFTADQWDAWNAAARENPYAWPAKPLLHCEDCSAGYRSAMIAVNRCERKDDKAVIQWLIHGTKAQAGK